MTIRNTFLPLLLLTACVSDHARSGVTTFQSGDTLVLLGTNQRDDIVFTQYDASGALLPKGAIAFIDNEGFAPYLPQIFYGVAHIEMYLGEGTSHVDSATNVNIWANVFVQAGSDGNFVTLRRIHGNVEARLGDGFNVLNITDVSRDVSVELGSNYNILGLEDIGGDTDAVFHGERNEIYAGSVGGDLTLNLSGGDNTMSVRGQNYLGDVLINAAGVNTIRVGRFAAQTSIVGDLTIKTLTAEDDVTVLSTSVLGSLDVRTGAGDDTVALGGSGGNGSVSVAGGIYINSGIHSDVLSLFSVSATQVTLDTLSGSDYVEIDDCQFETLFTRLRNGHDVMVLRDCFVVLWTFLDGGNHSDAVTGIDSDLGSLTHQNFEGSSFN